MDFDDEGDGFNRRLSGGGQRKIVIPAISSDPVSAHPAQTVGFLIVLGMPRIDTISQIGVTQQNYYRWKKVYGALHKGKFSSYLTLLDSLRLLLRG